MRRKSPGLIGLVPLLILVTSASSGQIIENPAKPVAKDAGRILGLTEAWRITDESGEFYFRRPFNLQVADDGSVFIADAEELLRFSSGGKFLKNLYKKGQGPGEINGPFMYSIRDDDVFIQDMDSRRFWRADLDGVYKEEIPLKDRDIGTFLGAVPDGYIFQKMIWPPRSEWTGKLTAILHNVDLLSNDGSDKRHIATFKTEAFLGPRSATNWDSSIAVLSPGGESIIAFFGREYLVEVVDITGAATSKRFRRTYPRIPHVESPGEKEVRIKRGFPKIEYETDIRGVSPADGRVWLATSTEGKAKGWLIDVFDMDGHFVDSFYLGAGRTLMAVREGCIFCQEKNQDETIMIVKYKIDEPALR